MYRLQALVPCHHDNMVSGTCWISIMYKGSMCTSPPVQFQWFGWWSSWPRPLINYRVLKFRCIQHHTVKYTVVHRSFLPPTPNSHSSSYPSQNVCPRHHPRYELIWSLPSSSLCAHINVSLCHMLYFHQVQFPTLQFFNIFHTTDLFLTQLRTCLNPLLLFKLHLSFYLSFYCSLFFPSTLFCLSFDHLLFYSLIILCTLCTFSSFVVFACEYLLHVILSVPCYKLPFPSLTVRVTVAGLSRELAVDPK